MKHAKIFCFIITCCLLLSSCASTRGTNQSILDYQREIDRLESELNSRDRTIESAVNELRAITVKSTEMEGTVDELIDLFDQYQRAVEQLLRDYSDLAAKDKDPN